MLIAKGVKNLMFLTEAREWGARYPRLLVIYSYIFISLCSMFNKCLLKHYKLNQFEGRRGLCCGNCVLAANYR